MEILASPLFPSMVWTVLFDDRQAFNASVLALAYKMRDSDPEGVANTNIMGWQSKYNLQQLEEFRGVNDRILSVCRQIGESQNFAPNLQYRHQAWINISPPGASNRIHMHPNSHLSGVYYVSLDAPGCGSIFFRDPRAAATMMRPPVTKETHFTASEVRMRPEEGRMYVFPSWLEHGVETNQSERDRISMSFNVQVSDRSTADGTTA